MCRRKMILFLFVLGFCALILLPALSRPADAQYYYCNYPYVPKAGWTYWWVQSVGYPVYLSGKAQRYQGGAFYCQGYGFCSGDDPFAAGDWRLCCTVSPYYAGW